MLAPRCRGRTVDSMTVLPDFDTVRKNLGRSLFGMVAGPDGPANRARIHNTPGPRWFDDDRPIRRVHGDASMSTTRTTAVIRGAGYSAPAHSWR
jgi:hypothetical protein